MSLHVYLPALTNYADQLDRAFDDATAAREYLRQHCELSLRQQGVMGALINYFGESHDRIVFEIDIRYGRIADVLSQSAIGLRTAEQYYRQTDTAIAERLDQTIPYYDRDPRTYHTGEVPEE